MAPTPLLAEELLSQVGIRLPYNEREVIKAINYLGEPPPVVLARRARRYLSDALQAEIDRLIMDADPTRDPSQFSVTYTVGDPVSLPETPPDREQPLRIGGSEGYSVAKRSVVRQVGSHLVINAPGIPEPLIAKITPEAVNAVPDQLKPYLYRSNRLDVERSYAIQQFAKLTMSTGGIFVVDPEVQDVLRSVFGGIEVPALPPLPFQRIWIEAADGAPLIDLTDVMPEGTPTPEEAIVTGIGIAELARGTAWGVTALRHRTWMFGDSGDKIEQWSSPYYQRVEADNLHLVPDDPAKIFAPAGTKDGDLLWETSETNMSAVISAYAIVLVDLITARGVRRDPFALPRPRRRAMMRYVPDRKTLPSIYRLSIATGDPDDADETGRHLTCRFLVRGHWRVSEAPHAEFVPVKGATCVWINAYVKGPIGSPWRGRPIYTER